MFQLAYPNCWIKQVHLPPDLCMDDAQFERIWELKPTKRGELWMGGKVIATPRWTQSYGKDYVFSATRHVALPIPPEFQAHLDWVQKQEEYTYNQLLVNWYGENDHIGKHADSLKQLVPDAPIYSFSFHQGQERSFVIHPESKDATLAEYKLQARKGPVKKYACLHLNMPHNSVLWMGGKIQSHYKHSVPPLKQTATCNRRINITVRAFL